MNRLPMLGLLVGCLALVSRSVPVIGPSTGLAQEEGKVEAAANEDASDDDSRDEGSGTVSEPHGPAANDDSEEDEPATNNEQRNRNENEDEGAGTDEAASRSPASPAQHVEAL
jgi:hypothetical protein